MRPIQERLTMLAADLREDSRKAGIAAEQARPDVEDTAAVLATLQQTEADLNAQIDELERRLAETRRHILQAEAEHEQAKSVVKRHERDGQEAADMADRLDQLARGHRAPDDLPPAEALAATGLMPKQVVDLAPHIGFDVAIRLRSGTKVAGHLLDADREHARIRQPDDTVCTVAPADIAEIQRVAVIDPPPGFDPSAPLVVHHEADPSAPERLQDNGLPMVWSDLCAPGGYVCAVPAPPDGPGIPGPDGTRICGQPVESEPCSDHGPDDVPPAPRSDHPFTAVPADPDMVARVTSNLPVATPPVPRAPADMTMPDVGPPVEPLPPAEPGQARHAAPRDANGTGRMRALGEKFGLVHPTTQTTAEQTGDDQ